MQRRPDFDPLDDYLIKSITYLKITPVLLSGGFRASYLPTKSRFRVVLTFTEKRGLRPSSSPALDRCGAAAPRSLAPPHPRHAPPISAIRAPGRLAGDREPGRGGLSKPMLVAFKLSHVSQFDAYGTSSFRIGSEPFPPLDERPRHYRLRLHPLPLMRAGVDKDMCLDRSSTRLRTTPRPASRCANLQAAWQGPGTAVPAHDKGIEAERPRQGSMPSGSGD